MKNLAGQRVDPGYTRLPIEMELCVVALEEAARFVGPSFIYDLFIHPDNILWARKVAHACHVMDNPFSPYVNVRADSTCEKHEWYLQTGNKAAGSVGFYDPAPR